MADSKITALASIGTGTDPANDPLVIVDVSDVSPGGMSATGTTKKVTLNNLLACSPTATLASATITGDLTVDTSTLYVSSSADKVAIGTTSLSNEKLTVAGNISANAWLGRSNIAAPAGDCSIFRSADNTLGFGIASSPAMTLNSTGLGVGGSVVNKLTVTVAPGTTTSDGLRVTDSSRSIGVYQTGATYSYLGIGGSQNLIYTAGGRLDIVADSQSLFLRTGTNNYLNLDTSGNVGIGVTPSAWRSAAKALQVGGVGCFWSSASTTGSVSLGRNIYEDSAGNFTYIANSAALLYEQSSTGIHSWYSAAASTGTISFGSAKMTLDASGNWFIGKTATGLGTVGIQASPSGWFQATVSGDASLFTNRLASDGKTVQLYRQTLEVGNISVTTTGATFNSTSDYRLKEAVAPLSGGLARVNALKPSVYKWKSNGLSGEGFLAHELAEVVPFAVTGEKDAVNEDGSINAQSIDMSRVVPIIVAAIQELAAEVNALKKA